MNTIATFRKCVLSDDALMRLVDRMTDEIYTTGKLPTRHIPAKPDDDYNLLVGELILRFRDALEREKSRQLNWCHPSSDHLG
jgi:hypothetical protein